MAFLDKLKGFFLSEKDEVEREELGEASESLKIEEIDGILGKREKELNSVFNGKIEEFYLKLGELLDELEVNSGILESVSLDEKKSDDRSKQISELGRKDYVRSVKELINGLRKEGEVKGDLNYVANQLESFKKSTLKSYFKATFLIGGEAENVKNSVINIRRLLEVFGRENGKIIGAVEKLKVLLDKNNLRKNYEIEKEDILEEIKDLKGVLEKSEISLKKTDKMIMEREGSAEYVRRGDLVKSKEDKELNLNNEVFKVQTLLDRKLLEKYAHLDIDKERKKLAKLYVEDPMGALFSDENLSVMNMIEEIKFKIRSKEIVVKESDKALKKISLDREVFLDFKDKIVSLRDELRELDKEIDGIKLDIGDLIKEKESTESEVLEKKKHLEVLERGKGKIEKSLEDLNSELKEGI